MAIETDYLELMTQTVNVYVKSGALNNYAGRSFAASPTAVYARVQFDSEVQGSNGGVEEARDVYPKGKVYLYGNVTVSTDDKIILPDGQELVVRDVMKVYDESGVHHVKVTF